MSTAAVSSNLISEIPKAYFQTRYADLQQLGHALKSGDLAGAQTAYNNIVTLGQSGPFAGGNPFRINQREQDFTAIGQPLQSGDLAGAQQAFKTLASTFKGGEKQGDPPTVSNASSSGPEIVVNLSNSSGNTSPEQITINIANSASGGGEQVSLSVGNQGSNAQQITFNLSPNSNEEIVLNLLGGSSSTGSSSSSSATSSSSSGASSSTGLSVSA
jgi:hypothetical protein